MSSPPNPQPTSANSTLGLILVIVDPSAAVVEELEEEAEGK